MHTCVYVYVCTCVCVCVYQQLTVISQIDINDNEQVSKTLIFSSHLFSLCCGNVKFRVWNLVICAYYLIRKLYWFTDKLAKHCFSVYALCYLYFWSGNVKLCTASLLRMMFVLIVSQISHLCHTSSFLCSVSKTVNWSLKCGRWSSHLTVSSIKLSGSWYRT